VKDLLLEIGTEEIPARFVPDALRALESTARASLAAAGLSFGSSRALGTPRRLALIVERLADKSQDRTTESLGPAVAQAKGPDGAWTSAALGFARGQGVPVDDLTVKETDRGPRLAAVKHFPGVATDKLLPGLLAEWIARLAFPKSMVWEEGRVAFARPLRWIVALHGTKPIPLAVAGVKSGKKTRGLRFHAKKPIDVAAPAKYVGVLRNHCVIVDPDERRALIEKQIQQAVKTVHGVVPLDRLEDLLGEVVHLVEHPVAVVGRFNEKFLSLPPEVLVTSMKKHQKYFPVFADAAGRALTAHFVGIRNGLSDHQSVVREGYERVLAARLADAAFFFEQDRRRSLMDWRADLKGIAFLSSTLSVFDKTERVGGLAGALALDLKMPPDRAADVARASALSKADLSTGVVGEFPELQGVMGRIYAAADGEPPTVSAAVEQHYWPLTAEGVLPEGDVAAVVSVADKIDTLVGNFLIGKIPSGSQDPYGLRRAAIGLLRILEERAWPVSLPGLVDDALARLPEALGDKVAARRGALEFLRQRWAALAEARGARFDEIEAVLAAGFDRVAETAKRLDALRAIRRHPDFEPLSAAYKRAANLLKQAEKKGETVDGDPDPSLLGSPAERDLAAALASVSNRVGAALTAGDPAAAFAALVALRGPVDQFFTAVIIMDSAADVRRARLSLLAGVRRCFAPVADLSRLQDTPGPAA